MRKRVIAIYEIKHQIKGNNQKYQEEEEDYFCSVKEIFIQIFLDSFSHNIFLLYSISKLRWPTVKIKVSKREHLLANSVMIMNIATYCYPKKNL